MLTSAKVQAPISYSRKAVHQYTLEAKPPAMKFATAGFISHEVPSQLLNHLLNTSKPLISPTGG